MEGHELNVSRGYHSNDSTYLIVEATAGLEDGAAHLTSGLNT